MSTELKAFEDRLAGALREYAAGTPRTDAAAGTPREYAAGGGGPRRSGRGARRRSGAAMLVVAAAAAVVAVLALPGRGGGPAPATAAELLATAASAAEREAPLGAGRSLYVRSTFTTRVGIAPVHAGTQETWTRADGSGRTRTRSRSGRVVEDVRRPAGAFRIGTETLTPAELRKLDGAALRRLVARQTPRAPGFDRAQLRAFAAYRILHDILATPSSGALRGQAYRTLATAPGLRLAHRDGAAVTVAARVGDVEFRATIDTADGRVLALERDLLRRSAQLPGPPGVVDRWVVVAQSG